MSRRLVASLAIALALPASAAAQDDPIDAAVPTDAAPPDGALLDGSVAVAATQPEPPAREHLTVVIAGSPPFVLGDGSDVEGLSLEVWAAVADRIGVDYTLEPVANASEAIDAVRTRRADVAIGPLSITSDRARAVAFTQPYEQSSLALLTRPGTSSVWQRLRPFLSRTFFSGVAILLVVLLLVGTLVWALERKKNEGVPDEPLPGIGVGVWLALVTMTTVGYGDKAPVTLGGRIAVGVWMLIAMLSVSSLTAGIATALTLAQLDQGTIGSADELRGHPTAALEGTTAARFARDHGARVITASDVASAIGLLERGEVDAVVFDRPVLQFYLREHPDLDAVLAEQTYEPQGYGFALQLDSPLQRSIDVALLELDENGGLESIRGDWL